MYVFFKCCLPFTCYIISDEEEIKSIYNSDEHDILTAHIYRNSSNTCVLDKSL